MKTSELKKALELVRPGLATKELLEQSTQIIFHQDRLFTFNDEVAVAVPFQTGIIGAVPAGPLYAFLNKLQADVEIKIEAKENELQFSSGRNRAGIRREEEIKLPLDKELPEPEEWVELPDNFLKALDKVLFSFGRRIQRAILACIHITESYLESCDGFRMTRVDCIINPIDKEINQDVPLDINIIGTSLEKLSNYSPIKFALSNNWVQFCNKDNVRYCIRVVDGEYPDLNEFIDFEGKIIEFPSELSEALDWCSTIVETNTKYEQEVDINIEKGKITVRGEGPDGWAEKSIRTKYSGEPINFQGHPVFLKEMLSLARQVTIGDSALKIESKDLIHIVSLDTKEAK